MFISIRNFLLEHTFLNLALGSCFRFIYLNFSIGTIPSHKQYCTPDGTVTSGRRVESPVDRSSLPTLLANRFASTSSTDVRRILPLTRLTFKLNPHLLNDENECRIFPLDWSKEIRNFDRYYDIVLAAECCYNRDTSKNLFSLINWLFREEKIKMAIFTLEERPNFMLDSMSVKSTERDRNGSKYRFKF